MDDLEQLKHFMDPYYQEDDDLLESYLEKHTYPECAASALWYELSGKLGFENNGLLKMSTGAEKFEWAASGTLQLAAERQGKYYGELCDNLNNVGSCAVRVSKATVGGVTEEYGGNNVS